MTHGRSDGAGLPATTSAPSITLASGREVSKASLFNVLQVGGWTAAYAVCALAAGQTLGLWPTLVNTWIWAAWGFVITLGLHHVYRRSRRLRHSHVMFAAIALPIDPRPKNPTFMPIFLPGHRGKGLGEHGPVA